MFDFARRGARSARVLRTGAAVYIGYKRTQRSLRGASQAQADAAWSKRHVEFAERIFNLAVDLKGLYVKTAQFVGTRSDIFPEPYTRSLSRLQDRVPPRNPAIIRKTIERELGQPVSRLFAHFDDEPVAAASLAQVHRAELPDGRAVAVKVQYPEIANLVRLDVRNLRMLSGLIAWRERNFDYRAIVNEIATQVPLELDFVREAELTRRVGANLAGRDGLVVPTVVTELVTKRVLVTEFIEGRKLVEAGVFSGKPAEGARIAGVLAAAFGQQVLLDGLFQADPHPGNILLLLDGRIALLDFGMTKELTAEKRLAFARLVLGAAERDLPRVLAAFAELGLKTKSESPAEIFPLLDLFFAQRDPAQMGAIQRERTRSTLRQNPVEALPSDLILFGRVIGLLRGVCSSLGAPLSPIEILRPFAERALAEGQATLPAP